MIGSRQPSHPCHNQMAFPHCISTLSTMYWMASALFSPKSTLITFTNCQFILPHKYPETFSQLHTHVADHFLDLRNIPGYGLWICAREMACQSGMEFNSSYCNKKLIGARSFSKGMLQERIDISKTDDDYDSPRDYVGHDTHTSSTKAGSRVVGVEYFGYAKGTATEIAPKIRIAVYKDGVNAKSLPSGFFETPFDENPIAVGAFAPLKKGNNGPHASVEKCSMRLLGSLPFGAGRTIGGDFAAHVTLGDGDLTVTRKPAYKDNLFVSGVPIYFGQETEPKNSAKFYSLDTEKVDGKNLVPLLRLQRSN
ncbi:hypothetical protein QQP08_006095 [Theobroma cacao]|nr:hypothetical protein QQP08_006095 [Theobroma cacao]